MPGFAIIIFNGRHKFDPRAKRCVFIGYPFGIKGYTLLDLETKKIFVSRKVVFYENIFPFKSDDSINNTQFQSDQNKVSFSQDPIVHNETVTATQISNMFHDVDSPETNSQVIQSVENIPQAPNHDESQTDSVGDPQNLNTFDSPSNTTSITQLTRRSMRI